MSVIIVRIDPDSRGSGIYDRRRGRGRGRGGS